jgi:hypothetical protein
MTRRATIVAACLALGACGEDDFVAVEEAWLGEWSVVSATTAEGCDGAEVASPDDYTRMQLDFVAAEALFLSAVGCTGGSCDAGPWLYIGLTDATEEALSGIAKQGVFFEEEEGIGVCSVSWGVLEATRAGQQAELVLRRYTGEFSSSGYTDCQAVVDDTIEGECGDRLVYELRR